MSCRKRWAARAERRATQEIFQPETREGKIECAVLWDIPVVGCSIAWICRRM